MSSDNNDRPAPPSAPEAGSATSPRPGRDVSAAPAPEKASAPLPSHSLFRPDREGDDCLPPAARYSSENEHHHHDGEDDHSMTEFDLHAEIKTRLDKSPAPVSASTAAPVASDRKREAPAVDDDYFPEDERSSMDWESDSSMTDFDLNAELEARLGKAPPLPPADERPAPDPGPCLTPAGADSSAPHEHYFPEDERSSQDWEDDHSMTSFDPDAEVAHRLSRANPSPAAPAGIMSSNTPAQAPGTAQDKAYYPDDERSSMDWEDDHSTADFDLNAEIDSNLGKAAGEKPDTATPDDGGYMHPGLAASLSASLAYAQHGLRPDAEQADQAAESNDTPHSDEAIKKAAADAVRSVTAGDAPDDQLQQEKKRPFDGAGPAPASDASDPGQTGSTKNAPAVAESAVPASASGGGAGGGDDDDDEEEEDEEEDDDEDEEEEEEEDSDLGRPMTLRDHLNELRKRVTWAFLWVIVGFIACYPFAEELFKLLLAPLTKVLPSAGRLIYTSPPEAFFVYMKVAFVAGLFVTSPLVFYQIWAFVAPGLYKEEQVDIVPIAFFSALCFICGGAFCYFVAFPFAFEFFMSYSTDIIVAMPALDETLGFVLQLLLAFGLIFELPLFVFFLARLGIVTAAMMRKFRRYAILANVIIAAILTPPDVMSQMLMAGPLLLLYELSVLIAAFFGKKTEEPAKEEEDDEEEEEEEDEEEEDDASRSVNRP